MKGRFKQRFWADFRGDHSQAEGQIKAIAHAQGDALPLVRDAATNLVARAKEALNDASGKPRPPGAD
jgi:hypothetical protein